MYLGVTWALNNDMDKYERRRQALIALAGRLGRGGIAKIAHAIDKQPDYVSRMKYPAGKSGRKRIGEDTLQALLEHFPEDFLPVSDLANSESTMSSRMFSREQRADEDAAAVHLALRSLLAVVLNRVPGTAEIFRDYLAQSAKERRLSIDRGLLASLAGIADEALGAEESVAQALRRGRAAGRTKPRK